MVSSLHVNAQCMDAVCAQPYALLSKLPLAGETARCKSAPGMICFKIYGFQLFPAGGAHRRPPSDPEQEWPAILIFLVMSRAWRHPLWTERDCNLSKLYFPLSFTTKNASQYNPSTCFQLRSRAKSAPIKYFFSCFILTTPGFAFHTSETSQCQQWIIKEPSHECSWPIPGPLRLGCPVSRMALAHSLHQKSVWTPQPSFHSLLLPRQSFST